MITETTAISCAAFGALSTGLGVFAGSGWWFADRKWVFWQAEAWAMKKSYAALESRLGIVTLERNNALSKRYAAEMAMESMAARLVDTEDQLRCIERQRSDNTRRGNLTRSAKRKAAIAATTSELQQNIADRAEPVLAVAA